jgi:hypothetical protein
VVTYLCTIYVHYVNEGWFVLVPFPPYYEFFIYMVKVRCRTSYKYHISNYMNMIILPRIIITKMKNLHHIIYNIKSCFIFYNEKENSVGNWREVFLLLEEKWI